jgi:SAM-dependent methyltransferase
MKFNNKCSFCGNQKFLEIFKNLDNDPYLKLISKNYAKKNTYWLKCKNCDVFFQNPMLEENDLKILYKKNYRKSEQSKKSRESLFNKVISYPHKKSENLKKINIIRRYLPVSGKLLDVGCGMGAFLFCIKKKIPKLNLTGLEVSAKNIKYLENYDINLINGFFIKQKKQFDVITCLQVLEHVFDLNKFITNLKNSLKKNGKLVIEVPHVIDFKKLKRNHIRFYSPHLRYFPEKFLIQLFKKYKFKKIYSKKIITVRKRNNLLIIFKKI